jgi:hypothetical protein
MGNIDLELKEVYIMTKSHNDILWILQTGRTEARGLGIYGQRPTVGVQGPWNRAGHKSYRTTWVLDGFSILEYCVCWLFFRDGVIVRIIRINKSRYQQAVNELTVVVWLDGWTKRGNLIDHQTEPNKIVCHCPRTTDPFYIWISSALHEQNAMERFDYSASRVPWEH